jgi:membrane fusion protein, copper/silver efflux system
MNTSRQMRARHRLRARIVLAVIAAIGGCTREPSAKTPRSPGGANDGAAPDAMRGMPGMAGMPGMQMSADGSAQLSAAALRQFGVTFGTADERELRSEFRAVGTVALDESGVVMVTTKVGGFIERLDAKVTGQRVRRGQVLAAIYAPDVLVAQEELLVAQRLGGRASERASTGAPGEVSLLSAARRRLRLLDVSDVQIDEVLRSQRAQRTLTIVSPISGVLTQRDVTQGQAVQAGMAMFTIADQSRLWIDVRIPAASGASVREGMLATYTVTGVPGLSYTGRIAYIYPTVGDQSRTLSARVPLKNADGAIKPGMFANVVIASPGRRALTVPRAAVIETGERSVVFVDMGGGRLIPRDVEVGTASAELIEILAGLEPGQRVVTSAQFLLESESNLAEVMRSMIGMGAMSGAGGGSMQGMEMGPGPDTKGTTMPGMVMPPAKR